MWFFLFFFSVISNLLLSDCFAHHQPSACCSTENIGQGRIYLMSCIVNCGHLGKIQGMSKCSVTAILFSYEVRPISWTPKCIAQKTTHQYRSCCMKMFFEHSYLTSPLTWGSILWKWSSHRQPSGREGKNGGMQGEEHLVFSEFSQEM